MEKMNITHKIVAMQPELEHFAYKLTADRESANDLVQDCLLKALDNKEKFVHTQNFKGWMYTIMRNIFINNYRKSLLFFFSNYRICKDSHFKRSML